MDFMVVTVNVSRETFTVTLLRTVNIIILNL